MVKSSMNDEITDTFQIEEEEKDDKKFEITEEGKKPQDEIIFVRDEERAETLDDPVRYAIITVLKRGVPDTKTTKTTDEATGDTIIRQRDVTRYALSVVEIVKKSGVHEDIEDITKNQVYHHLPKLIDAGFIIKFGTITTGKRTTDYYRRTAKGFVLTTGMLMHDEKHMRKKLSKYTERMMKVFDLDLTEEQQKMLEDLRYKIFMMQYDGRSKVAAKIKGDIADKEVLDMYEFLIHIHAIRNDEYVDLHKQITKLIFPDT